MVTHVKKTSWLSVLEILWRIDFPEAEYMAELSQEDQKWREHGAYQ